MMVAGHSFFELANPEYYDLKLFPWDWWSFLRGKTAPTFLFLSGAVHVFANFKGGAESINDNTFRRRIVMAVVLLIIGYTLNSPVNSFSELFAISSAKLELFYQVNILHIFGIGLFILAMIYRFAGSEKKVLYINIFLSIVFLICSPVVVNANLDYLPKFLSNYFNYQSGSIFTLLPYSAYIFLGTVFGILLRRRLKNELTSKGNTEMNISKIECSNKLNQFFNLRIGLIVLLSSIFFIILGIIITKTFLAIGMRFDMRSDMGVVIRNTGIILFIIFLARQIKIGNIRIIELISTLSKRAIFIYVIHLFIIYGIGNIHGMKYYFGKMFEPPTAFLLSFFIIIASILITLLIDKSLKYKFFKKFYILLFILYSIVFLLQ